MKIKNRLFIFLTFICLIFATIFIIFNNAFILTTMANSTDSCADVPIIMYHGILKNSSRQNKFVISPTEFENDLKYLVSNNYHTIFVKDLIDFVYDNKELPDNPILLTFDDGYYNNYLYAFPLAKQYNCKFVLAPIGKQVDIYSETDDTNPNYSHINWEKLKEMSDSGFVEIQNHSYNMHTMNKGRNGCKKNKKESLEHYKKSLIDDISKMQSKVTENIGSTPSTFVYPFGAISNCSKDILKELGFKCSFSCENKINKITKNPDSLFNLCRFIRVHGPSSEDFFKKIKK